MNTLEKFQRALAEASLDGAVIAAPEQLSSVNLRYLSGFSGSSAYLVIVPDAAWILTDFRYLEQVKQEAPQFTLVRHGLNVSETIAKIAAEHGIRRMGYEADKIPVAMWRQWNEFIPVVWRPLDGLIETLRLIKTPEEIKTIREASRVAGEALLEVLPRIVGQREAEVALALQIAMQRRGAEALAFPTIVASGERGALPHAHPTDRVIQPNELVTIDFGALIRGYHSDETVTVATGHVSDELKHIFDVVAEAQAAGIAVVKPGATSHQVDSAARGVIEAAGYGDYFGHGTGHGVGMEVHENPFASGSQNPGHVLVPGMTITVEPGIYVPGMGGVRLEDTLVVTETGCERLTIVPKPYRIVA